jgi:hypothetical protein
VRIQSSPNRILDFYGLLDARYEEAIAQGEKLWVLRVARQTKPCPAHYLVVVDTGALQRSCGRHCQFKFELYVGWVCVPTSCEARTTFAENHLHLLIQ